MNVLNKKKEETQKFNNEFKNSIDTVFNNINKKLKEEEDKLDLNNENQSIKLKEINDKINESLDEQLKINEETNNKMLLIIKETCSQFFEN
jgi:hypothetical protein